MSPEPDRIAVPTNGRGPHPVPGPGPAVPSEEAMAVAFSPRQVALGFGILASLLVLVARWARRSRSGV